jgi:hypothetical protein
MYRTAVLYAGENHLFLKGKENIVLGPIYRPLTLLVIQFYRYESKAAAVIYLSEC